MQTTSRTKLNNICGCNIGGAPRGSAATNAPARRCTTKRLRSRARPYVRRGSFTASQVRLLSPPPINHQSANKMETTLDKELSVIDQLRQMDVGEVLKFPAGRSPYLRNLVSQRLINERLEGQAWSVNLDMENGITIVTRTA